MKINPKYGSTPVVQLAGDPAHILGPAVRQRERLQAVLSGFSDEQWAHQSRCDAWTSQDVIIHLNGVNQFWAHSIRAGVEGNPTMFLSDFDPVATPAQMVEGQNETYAETLETFVAVSSRLTALLASLKADGWEALAEAPPGHLSVSAVVHHALWDSWTHERDILLPLGIKPIVEADEVAANLRYASLLGPAIAANAGKATPTGTLGVAAVDPTVQFGLEVHADGVVTEKPVLDGVADWPFVLTGDAVQLVEALSLRLPMERPIPASHTWMFQGLRDAFDATDHPE